MSSKINQVPQSVDLNSLVIIFAPIISLKLYYFEITLSTNIQFFNTLMKKPVTTFSTENIVFIRKLSLLLFSSHS